MKKLAIAALITLGLAASPAFAKTTGVKIGVLNCEVAPSVGMIIASYTRAAAESMGKIENCAVGIMGRLEKFILIIIGSLLEYFLPVGAFPRSGWLELALIVVGATSYITSVQRMVYTYKVLGDKREV